jgi:serine/threonine protein kinase
MLQTAIKNYHILSELGRGGMALVYLAHDNKFATDVAVKVLNKEYVHNENIRKRFLAEARNMFRMSHPNIIKVTDLIDEGDTVAFVMEYIEGETLKDYLERKGKLVDDEIKSLFTQMLDALEYVHEQGLVHRDIKPSNFMITPNDKVKLMDFGIAKQTDPNTSDYTSTGTQQQMGTPMYMSPEQVHETKNVTPQSDIYSLGVVLWQMVTGKRPYDTKTLSSFQLQSKIVNEPLDKTNSHWDELIQKATAKDMASRFMSANAFKILLDCKNDKKVVEPDATIIGSNVKQQPRPEPQTTHVNEPLKKEELQSLIGKKSHSTILKINNSKIDKSVKLNNEFNKCFKFDFIIIAVPILLFIILDAFLIFSDLLPIISSPKDNDKHLWPLIGWTSLLFVVFSCFFLLKSRTLFRKISFVFLLIVFLLIFSCNPYWWYH